MKLDQLAMLFAYLEQMHFELPQNENDLKWGELPNYEDYKYPNRIGVFRAILDTNLNFSAMLQLNLAAEDGKTINLDDLNEEQEAIVNTINSYVQYTFYEAIAKAQNGVVYPFQCAEVWQTEELVNFIKHVMDYGKETNPPEVTENLSAGEISTR